MINLKTANSQSSLFFYIINNIIYTYIVIFKNIQLQWFKFMNNVNG